MIISLIILDVLFAATAQMLLRYGAVQSTRQTSKLPKILGPLQNFYTLAGLGCLGVSFFLYAFILSRVELNILFPVTTGATIVLVPIIATHLFKEKINIRQIIAIALIALGIVLIAVNAN